MSKRNRRAEILRRVDAVAFSLRAAVANNIVQRRVWRFIPFYLALIAAPLLFGGVKPESQAILGILLSVGLLLTARISPAAVGWPKWIGSVALSLLLLQVIPLPMAIIKILSPERARLAMEFPADGQIPTWITLTSSVALSVQRYWELALAGAAFVLARRHAALPGAKRRLAISVSVALVLLAISDFWTAAHGRETVLGFWTVSWGKGYGTFANHNHFANWIYVAAMFCIGWVIREFFRRDGARNVPAIMFVSGATLFALAPAFSSASRSGTIAFVVGLVAFAFSMRSHFHRRAFAIAASTVLIAATVVGLLAAEPVLKRFRSDSTSSTLALKTEMWKRTVQIESRFPIFGAGPGTFVRVFDHYKTAHGDGTFLHAENDFIELASEYGFPFTALIVALLAIAAVKVFEVESPAQAGAIAGATVFLAHATVEFVSFVPANLILFATLLGIAQRSNADNSTTLKGARFSKIACAIAMGLVAAVQLWAWDLYRMASRGNSMQGVLYAQTSLGLWPFATQREIGLLNLTAESIRNQRRLLQTDIASRIDGSVSKALEIDPLNWKVRLEQAWFELAYTTNRERALSNAWLTVRLNPLQGQIPLEFARRFATNDPDLALRFLGGVNPDVPANHREALDLAWTITRDPTQLWRLTPNTTNAILNLVRFAVEKRQVQIAAEACQALENRLPAEMVARLYLEAQQPTQALRLIGKSTSVRAQAIRVQALMELGRNGEATVVAASLFAEPFFSPILEQKMTPSGSLAELMSKRKARPGDSVAAILLAEKAAAMSPRQDEVLSNLTTQFPFEPRIAYLFFQSETNNPAIAAKVAASLAGKLVEQEPK